MLSTAATHRAAVTAATLFLLVPLPGSNGPYAQVFQNERVSASLVADVNSIAAGQPFRLGVKLEMKSGWHVNWINPGDAGLAPTIAWRLPEGFTAGMVEWPHPGRFSSGPLTTFGYAGSVLLWTTVTPPSRVDTGRPLRLEADVGWLACADVCIPGESTLSLTLLVSGNATSSAGASLFDEAATLLPVAAVQWQARGWYQDDHTLVLELDSGSGERLEGVYFYPYDQGIIDYARVQELKTLEVGGTRGGYRLTIARDRMVGAAPEWLRGVAVAESGWGKGRRALELEIPMLAEPR